MAMFLQQPVTVAMDLIVASLLVLWSIALYARGRYDRQHSVLLWSGALFVMGISSIVAAVTHGFSRNFDPVFAQAVWKLSADLVGLSTFFMLAGTIVAVVRRPLSYGLIGLAVPKYILYVIWVATHSLTLDDYRVVLVDYTTALAVILALAIYAAARLQVRWARWIIVSIAAGFLAGGIQQSGIVISQHFGHNDLYHVVMLISFYLSYRAVRIMWDRDAVTTT